MARRFTVSYAFLCACCDERYPEGTLATYSIAGSLVAVDCPNLTIVPSEVAQAEARANRCNDCFLVHAPHQKECA